MKKLIYYVACSIDGYIADKDGDVSWLDMIDLERDDHGFNDFYDSIDSLIMGRSTYEQILDFGEWPYPGKPCWVMTSKDIPSEYADVSITSKHPTELLRSIQLQGHHTTWLVGGGTLARSFHDRSLITEYYITLIPCIVGEGIPLLGTGAAPGELKLVESIAHDSGAVQLRYGR